MNPITLGPAWTYDEAVPTELAARWDASDTESLLVRDFARTMVNCSGLVVLVGSAGGLISGAGNSLVWVVLAGLSAVALALAGLSHRRSRRRPGGFAARQIDVILEHRREVSFGDWDAFAGADVAQEIVAARRADELARTVLALPGWSSEAFAAHRIRFDPVAESTSIRLAARQLYDLRRTLVGATDDEPSSRELEAVRAEWSEHLESSWSALLARVDAFGAYAEELTSVARIVERSEMARQLAASLDEHSPRLTVQTVGSEMAASHLDDLRSELRTLSQSIQGPALDQRT